MNEQAQHDAGPDLIANRTERHGASIEEPASVGKPKQNPRQKKEKNDERREGDIHSPEAPFFGESSGSYSGAFRTTYVFPFTFTGPESSFRAAFTTFRAVSGSDNRRRARFDIGAFMTATVFL
jgi:hypothetical protein